jgi:hypothetical protein
MHDTLSKIINAPTREAALEAALKDARAWASHWNGDRECGLPITHESYLDCVAAIDAALAKQSAPLAQAAE